MVTVAGHATMSELTPDVFDRFDAVGAQIRRRLAAICDGLPLQVTGSGSLFKITATATPIRDYRSAATADKAWEATASLALLAEGFLLTPTLSGAVSTVTTPEQIDAFLAAFERIVAL
jgi:glutamate-1-semialdehyde 2,1-aminomutase